MNGSIIAESTLTRLVQALVDALHPERIVLFGSATRDDAGPDSDIDLFIQVPAGTDINEAAQIGYAALRPLRSTLTRGVDIVVKDRVFVERYGDLIGSVVRSVKRDGKVLYEHP